MDKDIVLGDYKVTFTYIERSCERGAIAMERFKEKVGTVLLDKFGVPYTLQAAPYVPEVDVKPKKGKK